MGKKENRFQRVTSLAFYAEIVKYARLLMDDVSVVVSQNRYTLHFTKTYSEISSRLAYSTNRRKKNGGVALTQLSLTLHYSRRIFYYQHNIHT